MSEKGGGVSPVRVSRLKKRRRPKECALQTLSTSKQSRRDAVAGVAVHDGGGSWKENISNATSGKEEETRLKRFSTQEEPEQSRRARSGNDGSSGCAVAVVKKIDGSDANALRLLKRDMAGGESSLKGQTQPFRLGSPKSSLACMDYMDRSALLSAIRSMLGIDATTDFQQELERAFKCPKNHTENNQTNSHDDVSARNGVYHDLVGRIDPFTNAGSDEHAIAFPPRERTSSRRDATPEDMTSLQLLNLQRKTGHGMQVPSSWYQFPFPKTIPVNRCDDGQLAKTTAEEPATEYPPPPLKQTDYRDDDEQIFTKSEAKRSAKKRILLKPRPVLSDDDRKSLPSINSRPSLKCQGKVQITSDKGATIREMCDIDESNYVIGKLYPGDERYFIEKKSLPPPPILLDGSDEESDEECVAVVRYKIVLKAADFCALDQKKDEESGEVIGWISDRGRLADDPYFILKEV